MDKTDGQKAFDLLQEAIDRANIYDEVSLRSYSGRYMYGKECIGIDGDTNDLLKVVIRAAIIDNELFEDLNLDDISRDSMGMGSIWYWTHIDVDGVEFEDEDEEDEDWR
jgi:hypothetical protein